MKWWPTRTAKPVEPVIGGTITILGRTETVFKNDDYWGSFTTSYGYLLGGSQHIWQRDYDPSLELGRIKWDHDYNPLEVL